MLTRSQIQSNIKEFTQDFFDEASVAWRANKKVGPNLTFKYVCQATSKKGNPCKRFAIDSAEFVCAAHRTR